MLSLEFFPVSCPNLAGRMNSCKLLLIFGFLSAVNVITGAIVNQNVERTIDIASQLVKESHKITAENVGDAFTKYTFAIPETERQRLAFISGKDGAKRNLNVKEERVGDKIHFDFTFLTPSKTQTIYVETVYTESILPYPVEIAQSEKQLVKYNGNLYLYSPYKTMVQTTLIKLSSSNILSNTQAKPMSVSQNKITYGPFDNINAFTNQSLTVHYENQTPFMTVNKLERIIEVSHWGNIAVKESITITHTGAKLKGSFSRYEFQKDGRSGQAAVKSYKTILPASALDVYYRDSNGNISTSNMNVLRESVELELRPRFPLFGGWKTQYVLGYNVPSFEYLYKSNDNYHLRMRIIDHIFDDMVIDEATVKIILPEGTANIKLTTPYGVTRDADTLHYTYLDTVGRPVITFTKSNVVENHIAYFDLTYTFSSIALLQEPLLMISFIYIIFVITIVAMRLDFSISTTSHQHKE